MYRSRNLLFVTALPLNFAQERKFEFGVGIERLEIIHKLASRKVRRPMELQLGNYVEAASGVNGSLRSEIQQKCV